METDQRLLQVPDVEGSSKKGGSLQKNNQDFSTGSYAPFYDEDSFDDSRSMREYFNVVYKRLPYILALTILTTAAAAFYMYRQPSVYLATTTMLIEPRKPKVQETRSVNINFGNNRNYYNTQLRLMRNPELMQDVVIRLGLHENPHLLDNQRRGFYETVQSIFSRSDKPPSKSNELPVITSSDSEDTEQFNKSNLTPKEQALVERYAGFIGSGLDVERVEQTNLFTIFVTNTDPILAARFADGVATVFIEQDIEREMSGANKSYRELSKSIDDLKTNIAGQEQAFIVEMKKSGLALGDGSKVNDITAEELSTLGKQMLEAIDDRRRFEADYSAAKRANNPRGLSSASGGQVADELRRRKEQLEDRLEGRLEAIDKEIQAAEAELAKLKVKYTDSFPAVKQKQAEITRLKKTRADDEKRITAAIKRATSNTEKSVQEDIVSALAAKLEAARKREAQLEAAYNKAVGDANDKGVKSTKLTTLKREIETNRELLDTYIQRQKEQELTIEGGKPDNLKISANAVTPTAPIGPNRNRNIFIAFLVSLIGGIGLSFLLDYLDDSIKTSDDVGRNLGLPTLALIPHHDSFEKKNRKMLAGATDPVASTAMVALEDTRSAMAEAYRHLRTSLLFSSAGKPPETILVTSSQPSEGKTTTAINAAITLAQSGVEVVLIDCDLRRPRLHNHFNMENSHGLTNYISGERDTDNLLKPLPSLPNMKIITSGPIPPNPAELLSSNEMKNLLQFLKGRFKHVIIDSPPAISFTDAAILSTLVDGVVLVAMAGKSSVHLLRRFKQRLNNIGARIYGVVLNGIKPNSVEYGYYGYGYTYSYYTVDDDDSTPHMEDQGLDPSAALKNEFIDNNGDDDDYDEYDESEFIEVDNENE